MSWLPNNVPSMLLELDVSFSLSSGTMKSFISLMLLFESIDENSAHSDVVSDDVLLLSSSLSESSYKSLLFSSLSSLVGIFKFFAANFFSFLIMFMQASMSHTVYASDDRDTLSPIRAPAACVSEISINEPSLFKILVITY